jgi:hypothetical protein
MANNKTGLSYYSTDTDRYQDIRIKRLKKTFKCMGIAVYDYILCEIYRVRGCFIEWDESTAFDVADYFGLKETQVGEIVNYCCAVGLFNKELLASGSVLTSESIQKRYIEICTRAKRKVIIPEKLILVEMQKDGQITPAPEPVPELPVIPEDILPNNGDILPNNEGILPKFEDEEKRRKEKSKKDNNSFVENSFENQFEKFRKAYPATKRGMETEFENFKKKHKDWKDAIPALLPALEKEIEHKARLAANKQFCPGWKNLQTWINGRYWEQELPQISSNQLSNQGDTNVHRVPKDLYVKQ